MKKSRIILRACPRCQGDLFPDINEEDFACLQCGRRVSTSQMLQAERESAEKTLVAAA
jgi:tRNA(Ile2) C34 agmatinyltransferase TiaS